jgi:hypothetical protein
MPAVRGRSQLFETLARVAMLSFWALVLWGVLTFASTLANAWGEGPAAAFSRLVPARGASIWVWLSPLSVVLALAAGLAVAGLAVWNRAAGAPDEQ